MINAMLRIKTRLFPVIWGIGAYAFTYFLAVTKKGFPLLSSLTNLAYTVLLFLALISAIDWLNRSGLWEIGKKFVYKILRIRPKEITKDIGENRVEQTTEGDLIAIPKETVAENRQTGVNTAQRVYSILLIIGYLGISFWHCIRIFKVMPWKYADAYRGTMADAVLLLIFPCICALYLKMRDEGKYPTDTITRDIMSFFSYVFFAYAAVIAAASALKLSIHVILQWVYYAASLYIIVALAVNIALGYLQGGILKFNYTLFPKKARTEKREVSWKVSIKSLYTLRYTFTILPALALALGLVLLLSTTLFVVQPHQQAAVYRFGKLDSTSIHNEGLHLKFPWPIDKAAIYDVHRVSSMQIGYESSKTGNFLWGQAHDGGEYMLLLGNGNEMAAVNLKVLYVIADLYAYLTTCSNPEQVLSAAAYNALMSRTINTTLDSFLNVDRNSLAESVLRELSQFCESEKLGFAVKQIIVESIHPPVDLANVYQNVVSASVDKTTTITRAYSYAQAKVIEAAKLSSLAVDGARAMQYGKVSDAQKEAAILNAATQASQIAAGSYEIAKQLEVYEKIIKSNKVYAFSPGTQNSVSKFIIGKVNTFDASNVQGEER